MDCKAREPVCEKCDKDTDDCNPQAEKHGSSPVKSLSKARYDTMTAIERFNVNGFTYEKCKFCGSIIVRSAYTDADAEDADVDDITDWLANADSNGPTNAESDDLTIAESDSQTIAESDGPTVSESDDPINYESKGSINFEPEGSINTGSNGSQYLAEILHIYPRNKSFGVGTALQVNEQGEGYAMAYMPVDKNERLEGAKAYGMKLSEKGCGGICIQYDTRSCAGNRCKSCDVHMAGLCCKRHLMGSKNSNLLERDGGDYRNLMGGFFRCYKENSAYDDKIRRKLNADAARADAYRDEIRRQVVGADDAQLIYEWREYTLDDLLVMFPHIIRRPIRIEIQLLIYLFYNYRYPVDLEHAEARFHLPKRAINRYMRAYYGYSYSSMLSKIRNEHSKLLLSIPLLRIGEIGALVGYKSHYHFSLSFKRYEGISPKEYRESVIGGGALFAHEH